MKTRHTILKHSLILLLLLWTWLPVTVANVGALTVTVNKEKLNIDDPIELRIALAGDNPSQGLDISPLQNDFRLLSQGQSHQMQIINGNQSSKIEIILLLMPKRIGKVTIPALAWGQYQTKPITLEVTEESAPDSNTVDPKNNAPAPSSHRQAPDQTLQQQANHLHDDIYMETTVQPTTPYENSQMRYTVKIYSTTPIHNAQLTQPSGDNLWVYSETSDQNSEIIQNNKVYTVFERHYALFPKKAGTLILRSPQFVGNALDAFFSTRSLYSPFEGQTVTLKSPAKKLQIKAKSTPQQQTWLPAQSLSLSDSWATSPTQIMKVGEPIERTLTLQAKGLTLTQLPNFEWKDISGLKIYPGKVVTEERFDGQYVVSQRSQTVTYLPTRTGEFTLPEIHLPWFNVNKEKAEFAKIAAVRLSTQLGATSNASQATASPSSTNTTASSTPTPAEANPLSPAASPVTMSADTSTVNKSWLGYALLLVVSLALLAYSWRLFSRSRSAIKLRSSTHEDNLIAAVKKACYADDLHTTRQLVYTWLNKQSEILSPATRSALTTQLQQLDSQLYSHQTTRQAWDGRAFWRNLQKLRKRSII